VAECHTFSSLARLITKEYFEWLMDCMVGGEMALAKITWQGLVSIAILVAILWSCILTERHISHNARIETYRALRDMRYLKFKRRVEPVSRPLPGTQPAAPSARPVLG
jgi:hypothetical protein